MNNGYYSNHFIVIPAKAGIQEALQNEISSVFWIPAFAGMTAVAIIHQARSSLSWCDVHNRITGEP